MRNRQPAAQLSGRFVGRLAIERHQRRRSAGCALYVRAPLPGTDVRDLDVVLTAVDGLVVLVKDHSIPAVV